MKLVYIEWEDAVGRNNWMNKDDMKAWIKDGRCFVHSVGWVMEETDKYIVLSGQKSPESKYGDELFAMTERIPKAWIRKRKIIKL